MKKEKLFYSPINRYNGRQSFRYNFHDLLGFPYQRRNSRSSSNQTRYIINRPKPHRLVSQNANTEPLEKPTLKSPLPPRPPSLLSPQKPLTLSNGAPLLSRNSLQSDTALIEHACGERARNHARGGGEGERGGGKKKNVPPHRGGFHSLVEARTHQPPSHLPMAN